MDIESGPFFRAAFGPTSGSKIHREPRVRFQSRKRIRIPRIIFSGFCRKPIFFFRTALRREFILILEIQNK